MTGDLVVQWKAIGLVGSHYNPFIVFLFISGFIAVLTDLRSGKIFNLLTFPGMILGLSLSFGYFGWTGLGNGFLGLGFGLVLFGVLYALRVVGAGDVKYLMALGAWSGPGFVFETAVGSILLAGVVGFCVLLFNGQAFAFLRKLLRLVSSILIKELAVEVPKFEKVSTLPMAVPIVVSAWITYFVSPVRALIGGL